MEYKKMKKGFTLPELIAVLVVLTVLMAIGAGVFIRVRNSVLEKNYNDLVDYLTLKAEEYANETGIMTVSVQDLIDVGLVKPDDNEHVYDPRNKTTMNCYIIKLDYISGNYVATLDEEYINEDGTCKEYVKTSNYQICRVDGDNCYSINSGEWLTGDVTLGIHKKDSSESIVKGDNVSFNWETNIGINESYKSKNMVSVDSKGTKKIVYTCTIKVKGANNELVESQVISQAVWIDNEAPIVSKVEFDNAKVSATRDVKIWATDDNGSGIKGYAIVSSSAECSNKTSNYIDSNIITLRQNGTYKVCVMDNVGNVGISEEKFEISNIN